MAKQKPIKRIGILTGGGDCPGLNAVIRAVTLPAVTKSDVSPHALEVYGFIDSYAGLVYGRFLKLDRDNTEDILTQGGTILHASNKDNPFAMMLGSKANNQIRDLSNSAIETYQQLDLDALVVIGGDGTMAIAHRFAERGMNIVGVPKTIDNDLSSTDVTFGFDTAVNTATEAIDKIQTTAFSHHRIMVVEIMGRYAGWLTLHAGMAGGADVILLPEFPFSIDKICETIIARRQRGRCYSIIAVGEGAKPKGGKMVVAKTVKGSHDPIRLGGIGKFLSDQIEERVEGVESRVTVLGHVQRGGSPTPHDRNLSTLFGVAAIDFVMKRKFGGMVCMKNGQVSSVPLEQVTSELKLVKEDDPMVKAAISLGISFGI